jgi:hypothetical protein
LIINYVENNLIKAAFIEKFLKKSCYFFRNIDNPSIETCILALKLEELKCTFETISFENLSPNIKSLNCFLYTEVDIVPNPSHQDTLMNLKEKKNICALITGS